MKRFFGTWIIALIALTAAASTARPPAQPDTVPIVRSPAAVRLTGPDNKPASLHFSDSSQYMAIVFLSPECPLCQNYTLVLNRLSDQYKGRITLYGVIPGKAYSAGELEKFRTGYHLRFDLLTDRDFELVKLLKATTTPQVFLLSRQNEILYAGLIDNWAASLGVQRTVVTRHYLAAAIDAALNHLPIATRTTIPVGCLINTH